MMPAIPSSTRIKGRLVLYERGRTFESGSEGRYQLSRQLLNKTDSVCEKDLSPAHTTTHYQREDLSPAPSRACSFLCTRASARMR